MPQLHPDSPVTPYLVLNAYAVGFFPMAETRESERIFWVDPEMRGVLPLDVFHVSKSLKRFIKSMPFTITCNTDFDSVIHGCAAPTDKRKDTWLNQPMIDIFIELHRLGHAHSIEVWENDHLVGGLYGVAMGSAFFAESMFSRKPNASKVALVNLIARLKYAQFNLLDVQFVNPHLEQFGAFEIPREDYKRLLEPAILERRRFYSDEDKEGWLMQSLTQTS